MRELTNDEWDYIISRVLRNAIDAVEEARQLPHNDFNDGRALAYYEVLDTMKNEFLAREVDVERLGLGGSLERLLSPRGGAHKE